MSRLRGHRWLGDWGLGHAAAVLLTIGFVLTSCEQQSQERISPQPEAESESLEDVEAIEQSVRDYFAALDQSDFQGLKEKSVGELQEFAEWQRILSSTYPLGVLSPAAAKIDSLEVVSVEGDTAMVEITGALDETFWDDRKSSPLQPLSTDIAGPVTVVRDTTWKVADYQREGRSVRDQIYTRVQGTQSSQGVTITVVGADLRPDGTVLIVKVLNGTGLKAGGLNPTIVDSSGRRLQTTFGSDIQQVEVKGGSEMTTGFFFLNGLPSNTKTFVFVIHFILGCDPVCDATAQFDIPVQLTE